MDVGGLNTSIKSAKKGFKSLGTEVPKYVKPVSLALVGMGTAVTGALAFAVGKFSGFEKSMKNVAAVSSATSEEFDTLKNFALEMGSTTAFTAKEAADGMYYLASAGLSVADQMKTTSAVLDLAAATQSELAETSSAVVNTLSGFQLEADQSRRVADTFAESISASQATLSKLSTSIPITASAFSDMNWSIEDNVAALSLLYDRGGRAETAASGLRNAIKTLLDVTPDGTKALAEMGLTLEDVSPTTNTLAEIVRKLEQANFDTTDSIKIFGKENDAMSKLVSQGSAKLIEFEKSLRSSAGAAQKMRDVQLDSLSGDLTLLKSATEGAAISLGESLSPAIRKVTRDITSSVGWFNKLGETDKKMVAWGAASAGALALVTGGAGLMLTQLPKIAKGWQMVSATSVPQIAAIGAALLAVSWAANESYNAYKKWRDGTISAEEDAEGWIKASGEQAEAFHMLKNRLVELEKQGFYTTGLAIGDFGINLDKLSKKLGVTIDENITVTRLMEMLAKQTGYTIEKVTGLSKAEDEATESTETIEKAVKDFTKTLQEGESGWDNITKAFKDYTDITGEGYGQNILQAIAYYEEVKAGGLKTVEAERGVTNTIIGLKAKHFSEAGFLEIKETQKHAWEIDKREVIDRDYFDRKVQNYLKGLSTSDETLKKESGLIQEHFDWSVQAAAIRSQKEIRIRKDQYAEELAARESLERSTDNIFEREFLMAQEDDERQLELKNLSFQEDQRLAGEREKLQAKFLSSATANVKSELDLQSAFTKKTKIELGEAYQGAMELIQRVYDDYYPYYQKFAFDTVELEKWRATQIKAIDKELGKARIKELDDYYVSYDEKVRSHEELFGGAMSGLLRGRSIYEGMDPEYRQRLNYGLAQQVFFPEETSPSQPSPAAPGPIAEPSYSGGGGGQTININIQNVYGGDEAWANEFAEDIGRRIREQGYQE